MVSLTASGATALRMDRFNFDRLTDFDSVIVQKSSASLIIDVDGLRYTFTGSGVRYNAFDEPTAGTITGLTISSGGTVLFQVGGFAIAAPTFYLSTYAPNSPLPLIFAGNDNLTGSSANDLLIGYDGHDNLFGGDGADVMAGGNGNDHLYGQSANGGPDLADNLFGNGGNDYIQGNAGDDLLDGGDGSDRIQGGQGNDSIVGGIGNDTVNGNLGNDSIDGGADNDSLRGGQGNDSIAGGSGNDILSGDLGADTLSGGSGSDVFQFGAGGSTLAAPDRIADFTDGADLIAIGLRPAIVLTGAAQSSLSAAATLAQQLFDANPGTGEVAAIAVGSDAYIFYAGSGGATVDAAIQLAGVSAAIVTTGDFV